MSERHKFSVAEKAGLGFGAVCLGMIGLRAIGSTEAQNEQAGIIVDYTDELRQNIGGLILSYPEFDATDPVTATLLVDSTLVDSDMCRDTLKIALDDDLPHIVSDGIDGHTDIAQQANAIKNDLPPFCSES